MPETRTITVFTFEELDGAAKTRAEYTVGDWLREDANSNLEEFTFKPVLEEWGFPTDKIEWSLGHSQGDGMAFYGDVDVRVYAKKVGKLKEWRALLAAEPWASLARNSFGAHYSHWNTMEADADYEGLVTETRTIQAQELQDALAEDVKTVSRELAQAGYDALDVSEEDIREHCEANDFRFNADGTVAS